MRKDCVLHEHSDLILLLFEGGLLQEAVHENRINSGHGRPKNLNILSKFVHFLLIEVTCKQVEIVPTKVNHGFDVPRRTLSCDNIDYANRD